MPVEPERCSSTGSNVSSASPSRSAVGDLSESSVSHLGVPISPRKRYDLTYRGNPDTKPICSYEVTFLVRMLHQISSNINEKVITTFLIYQWMPPGTGASTQFRFLSLFSFSSEPNWRGLTTARILLAKCSVRYWRHQSHTKKSSRSTGRRK